MEDEVEEHQREVIMEAWLEKCSTAGSEDERGLVSLGIQAVSGS